MLTITEIILFTGLIFSVLINYFYDREVLAAKIKVKGFLANYFNALLLLALVILVNQSIYFFGRLVEFYFSFDSFFLSIVDLIALIFVVVVFLAGLNYIAVLNKIRDKIFIE